MKTGNTGRLHDPSDPLGRPASMEPGHEDREYSRVLVSSLMTASASMEPGHEDREYFAEARLALVSFRASMEPGHEDREYTTAPLW